MSTPPRWIDRGSNIIPIESLSAMARMRLQEARQYAAEAEKEAEAAREQADKLTAIAESASEQLDYWGRITEIGQQVDLRLAAEGDVSVSGDGEIPPAPHVETPPF